MKNVIKNLKAISWMTPGKLIKRCFMVLTLITVLTGIVLLFEQLGQVLVTAIGG